MAVSAESIARIKQIPVSAVLEAQGVKLKRIGREFVTHCLWHDDRNPSLTISDDKGFVFCHVCQHSTDAIGYVERKFGLNFRDSCEKIAATHNFVIELVDEDPEEAFRRREQINKCLSVVSGKHSEYRNNLRDYPKVIDYINSRGIEPVTSREFELGYDARGNRLTIPIHNFKGEMVGFTGRALGDEKPKYKNSENNLIFNKSELVFNEHRASDYIREADELVFVEGHLDVITLWQHGIRHVVALQGTSSPSEIVVKRLLRKTRRFVLMMDGDQGGKLAVGKFIDSVKEYALDGQLDIRIALLPAGSDPDEAIRSGYDLRDIVANSSSWMDWILDDWLNDLNFDDTVKIQKVEKEIKSLFSRLKSPALRTHYFDKASIRLAQNKQAVAAQIAKSFHEGTSTTKQSQHWDRPSETFTRQMAEKSVLRLYIHKQELRVFLKPIMPMLRIPAMVWLYNRILEIEDYCQDDQLPTAVKAILSVAEPHYLQTLRPIAVPTINIVDQSMVIAHIEDVLTKDYSSTDRGNNMLEQEADEHIFTTPE